MRKTAIPAVAYLRTSSATNVGEGKDSHVRQWTAIEAFAKRAGYVIREPAYYDAAVSGSDPIDARPGFRELLAYLSDNPDVRVILVETANRFARDLIVQETGYRLLKERGIELIAVDTPGGFLDDTPTAQLVRQVMGAIAQFEKANIVAKLRGARERKRAAEGKCEGRKSHHEVRPEVVELARKLRRKRGSEGKRLSYRDISAQLALQGHYNGKGNAYHASAIRSMLKAA
ncbi:recombinase family protein [Pseudoxanthomonas helianthi]|uniref:Recombinase family protein n=1 Tax=Pseudoxanthomonas helianthi TaxID=1453541 RepID=A0A941ASS2_9GAMM|nr:recombinase family protein [Pseudoxanthomonas helianthi]MBP3983761.1 recombinase family protein [Pseudoxanthomonas helianthi]